MKRLSSFSLLLLFAAAAYAQSYDLKYDFKEGKTYIYNDVSNNELIQEMMGSEMKVYNNARTLIRMVGEGSGPDEIKMVISLDSAVSETKTPMLDTTIIFDQIIGKRTEITFNRKGEVLKKELIDSVDLSDQSMQMGQKEALQLTKLPDKEVAIGEKWSITKVDTLEMMGGTTIMKSEMEFMLSGKDEKLGYEVLKMPFTAKITIEGNGKVMGFVFSIEGEGVSKGDYYFSAAEGIPVLTETEQNFNITMSATGDQNIIIPITQVMKSTMSLVN